METRFISSFEKERQRVEAWFIVLRDKICETLEELEGLCLISPEIPPHRFQQKEWKREGGGGGGSFLL